MRGLKTLCAGVTFSAILATGGVASASLISYEGFNYNGGSPFNLSGASGGSGFSSSWSVGSPSDGFRNEVSASYTIPAYPGHLSTTGYGFRLVSDNTFNPGGTNSGGGPTGATNFARRSVATQGTDNTTLWASFTYNGGEVGNTLAFRLNQGGSSVLNYSTPATSGGSGAASNLVVVRIDFGSANVDVARVYLNPNLATFNPATATPTLTTGAANLTFSQLEFFLSSPAGSQYRLAYVDELRLGTTAEDVTNVIPEPASFAAVGLLSLVGLRRRR